MQDEVEIVGIPTSASDRMIFHLCTQCNRYTHNDNGKPFHRTCIVAGWKPSEHTIVKPLEPKDCGNCYRSGLTHNSTGNEVADEGTSVVIAEATKESFVRTDDLAPVEG